MLGPAYAPLRKDFWKVPKKYIRKEPKNVFISMGGGNIAQELIEVIAYKLKSYFKSLKMVIPQQDTAKELKKKMISSDIAITAGGQTTFELVRVGIPMVIVAIAENQLENAKGWHELKVGRYVGWYYDKRIVENIVKHLEDLSDYTLRKNIYTRGRSIVDGLGAIRIARRLINAVASQ